MTDFDFNSFNFSSLSEESGNPFEQAVKKSYVDERFYTLAKDPDGKGQAMIALLPDSHKQSLIQAFKINTTVVDNGKRRFLSTWSPKTIGKPDPFNETYVRLWQEGDQENARLFRPQKRFICNIKVIKDPANPENEGKIFLYEFSQKMSEKIQSMVMLSDADLAMGLQRKEVFNPFKGYVFRLTCYKGSNGITTYDSSEFIHLGEGNTIYGPLSDETTKQKALDDILNKTYDLSEFKKPESFKSYDELYRELQRICNGRFGVAPAVGDSVNITISDPKPASAEVKANVTPAAASATTAVTSEAPKAPEAKFSTVDDLLNSL